jgi:Mg-chelatase subunit ChlD
MKRLIATILLVLMALPIALAQNEIEILPVATCGQSPNYVTGPNDIAPTCRPRIDVVFLIDSTGSMADEIRSLKTHIIDLVRQVQKGNPRPDVRVGLVTYRDHKPQEYEYLYKRYALTRDVEEALGNIVRLQAYGGGDYPEAVSDGLHVALNQMNWDANARKIIFLIGDAAPHGVGANDESFHQGCPSGHNYKKLAETAREEGIKIYTISGSGMDRIGIRVWKDIAEITGGEYEGLTYLRKDVDLYYEEEGVDMKWAAEAKKDSDYDARTNTIMTNTFGTVAKTAVMQEATAAGVSYEHEEEIEEQDDSVLSTDSIIESEPVTVTTKPSRNRSLSEFFRSVLEKIMFWK